MNLFTSLAHWATRQDENVLTDAFVCLLHHLRDRETTIGDALLSWVCFGDGSESLPGGACIETQQTDELGRPDVWITAQDVFCLIEVKKWSGFGPTQLDRYRRLLGKAEHRTKRLILLTARPVPPAVTTAVEATVPVRRLRWPDVAARLTDLKLSDPVAAFLTAQFLDFLHAEGLTMEPVTADLRGGVAALRHLIGMIETGLKQAGVPIHMRSAAWDSVGWYLHAKRYWVGIGYDVPHRVRFAFSIAAYDPTRFAALGRGQLVAGKPTFDLDLSNPDLKFFSLQAHEQLDAITAFLKVAHADCLTVTTPNPVANG